jgi:PleD family two-component response regulator
MIQGRSAPATVLVAVDDLMFASRIRNAAARLGTIAVFARSAEDLIAQARRTRPALVIVDLNNTRIPAVEVVAALKADPACRAVRTVGFVSHVQADVIAAARAAGIDEVLARSAFTTQLASILGARDEEAEHER